LTYGKDAAWSRHSDDAFPLLPLWSGPYDHIMLVESASVIKNGIPHCYTIVLARLNAIETVPQLTSDIVQLMASVVFAVMLYGG
jgi:hypothetical protein